MWKTAFFAKCSLVSGLLPSHIALTVASLADRYKQYKKLPFQRLGQCISHIEIFL